MSKQKGTYIKKLICFDYLELVRILPLLALSLLRNRHLKLISVTHNQVYTPDSLRTGKKKTFF